MIYLVTNNPNLVSCPYYEVVSVQKSLELLEPLQLVGLDTETSGLDPYTCDLLLLQLGCFDFQVVVDCRTVAAKEYKEYLESTRVFLGWNLKFDLKFLYRQGIYVRSVYDGFLAEKLMWLGYPNGMHSMSLKSAGLEYLEVELDKSVRGKIIWSTTLTEDVILYGANDVKYLEKIKEKQEEKLKEQDLLKAVDIENRFVLPLSYCEYCGVRLDVERWKAKMVKDEQEEKEALAACNEWMLTNEPNSPYIVIDRQGDLFSEVAFDLSPKVVINWNSAKQVAPIFKKYGVKVELEDSDSDEPKDSINAKSLKPQAKKCSLIPIYLRYKEAVKVTSTYGQNFLDQINPVSHRIHTNYKQMGADTTRITSGGKDKAAGIEYVNLLNLPADKETRACFIAEDGNKWISIDYSGQETYLMASIANDKAIINELVNGSGDIHSLTAYMSYHEIPRDTPIKDIKEKFHEFRQDAKGIEFAINYGGDFNTISRNKGIPLEEAKQVYDAYMAGFTGLKQYQDYRRKEWYRVGYIELNQRDRHKAYIYDWQQLKAIERRLTYEFYAEAKPYKGHENLDIYENHKPAVKFIIDSFANGNPVDAVVGPFTYNKKKGKKEVPVTIDISYADAYRFPIKHFYKRKSSSEKQSINYPIQGSGSACLRYSLIIFFYWLRDNNLFEQVKICITPYDEINVEAPAAIAEEVAAKIHECMVKGGSYFCTRCKLDADMSRLPDGTLPTYWIH